MVADAQFSQLEVRPIGGLSGQWSRIFGYDIFISFALGPAPRGTRAYASDLARRLREAGFTVFFSEDEAPPGAPLTKTLRAGLMTSRMLVVVTNRGTLEEPRWVRREVKLFRLRHPKRSVIPISMDGALQDPAYAETADRWLGHRGKIWIEEDADSAQSGKPSQLVIDRLLTAPSAVRSLVRLRAASAVLIATLATLTLWANDERIQANSARVAEESARWYAEAQLVRHTDPDLAVQRLLRSLEGRPTRQNVGLLYPELALRDRLMATLRGHTAAVQAVQMDRQHRRLLSVSEDGTARVWDMQALAPIASISVSERPLVQGTFSPDGRFVLLTDEAGMLVIADGSKKYRTIPIDSGDAAQPTRNRELRVPNGEALLTRVAVSPDSKRVATWAPEGVWLIDLPNGRVIRKIAIKPAGVTTGHFARFVFSPDSRLLLATSTFGVNLFSAESGESIRALESAESCKDCQGAFTRTGRHLLVEDTKGGIERLFRVDGDRLTLVDGPKDARLQWIDAPGQHAIWLLTDKATLLRTALESSESSPSVLKKFSNPVNGVTYDDRMVAQVAMVRAGDEVWRWDANGGEGEWHQLYGNAAASLELRIDSLDLQMESVAENVFRATYFRHETVTHPEEYSPIEHHADTGNQDAFRQMRLPWLRLGDSSGLLIRDAKGAIQWRDLASGGRVAYLAGHSGELRSWIHDSHADRVFAAATDGTIRVWDVRPSMARARIGDARDESFLGISENRRYAVVRRASGDEQLVDLSTDTVLSALAPVDGHTHEAAVVSNDGGRVVTVSRVLYRVPGRYSEGIGPLFRVWETKDKRARLQRQMGTLPDPALANSRIEFAMDGEHALKLSPAGDRLIYFREEVDNDAGVELWDVESGRRLTTEIPKVGGRRVVGLQMNWSEGVVSWYDLDSKQADPWRYVSLELASGKRLRLSRDDGSSIVARSKDSDHILVKRSNRLFIERHGSLVVRPISATFDAPVLAAFGHGGEWLAIGNEAGAVDVVNVRNGTVQWRWTARKPIRGLRFSHDGRSLLITTSETFQVMDMNTQALVREHTSPVYPVAISSDDRLFVGLSQGWTALYSLDSGEAIQNPMPDGIHSVQRATFNDFGQIVLERRDSGVWSVEVWDCSVCTALASATTKLRERTVAPKSK